MIPLDALIQIGDTYPIGKDDPWWLEMVPTILGVALGTLGSFIVALWLFNREKKAESDKDSGRLAEVREYFYVCLSRYIVGLNDQIEILEKCLKEIETHLDNNKFGFIPLNIMLSSSPVLLFNINKEDTYRFFVAERQDDKIRRIETYTHFYILLFTQEKVIAQLEEIHSTNIQTYLDKKKRIVEIRNQIFEIAIKKKDEGFKHSVSQGFTYDFKTYDPYLFKVYKLIDENYEEDLDSLKSKVFDHLIELSAIEEYQNKNNNATYFLKLMEEAFVILRSISDDKIRQQAVFLHMLSQHQITSKNAHLIITIEFSDLKNKFSLT